jgi:hypothetical protein
VFRRESSAESGQRVSSGARSGSSDGVRPGCVATAARRCCPGSGASARGCRRRHRSS